MITLSFLSLVIATVLGIGLGLFLIFSTYRWIVIQYVRVFKPDLGPILHVMSGLMEDDHCYNPNNSSIVCILCIKGDLTLEQLQATFERNVLNVTLSKLEANRSSTLRYPELRSFPVNFMGHRFWKLDSQFKISNHIKEVNYKGTMPSLSLLHKERLNMTFEGDRSPWELNLVRRYTDPAGTTEKTLIILRIHHSLADAKSLVKLFVEGLGQTKLCSPEANFETKTVCQKLKFYLTLPYELVLCLASIYKATKKTSDHPWRVVDVTEKYECLVGISPEISVDALKSVAKTHKVKVSSVIMSIICGAIVKLNDELSIPGGLPVGYALPKKNHPEFLTNHVEVGMPVLPTDESNLKERLRKCHLEFERIRFGDESKIVDFGMHILGTLTTPLRIKLALLTTVTVGITNIAGDEDGFSVGELACTDFTFCTAIPRAASQGVVFTVFSYKGSLRVYITAKSNVIDEKEVETLAELIGTETEAHFQCFNC